MNLEELLRPMTVERLVGYVRAFPITHRLIGKPPVERYHWRLDAWRGMEELRRRSGGFSYQGDNEDGLGWKTRAAAVRAGRETMRTYFAQRWKKSQKW